MLIAGISFSDNPRWSKKGIIDNIISIEGGSVDDPKDLGGKTGKGGLTMALAEEYKHLWAKHGFDGDYRNMPYSFVFEVYDLHFWRKMWLDDIWSICPLIADCMMNWGINSGTTRPVKTLQRHVTMSNKMGDLYPDIVADGYFGPKSLRGLKSYFYFYEKKQGLRKIVLTLLAAQWDFYGDITEAREDNERFYDGWQNRVLHILDDVHKFEK